MTENVKFYFSVNPLIVSVIAFLFVGDNIKRYLVILISGLKTANRFGPQ